MGTSRHDFLDSRTEYCVAAESKKVQTVSRSEETREREAKREREIENRRLETRNVPGSKEGLRFSVYRTDVESACKGSGCP